MPTLCRILVPAAIGVGAVLVMMAIPEVTQWPVGRSCAGTSFNSLFNQAWCWLNFNKDTIGPIVQLLGVAGVIFAARSFFRTQQLNQANAVFQTMKEARDLQLKLNPPPAGGAAPKEVTYRMGLNFHASIFQYRLLDFVDEATWRPFEEDVESMVRNADIANWLRGEPNKNLPSLAKFDPRFIEYLRSVQQQTIA
jgi:hypothetical protein